MSVKQTGSSSLGRLRGEVVKVAQKEGSPIRMREVSPLKQWESLGNQIDVLARTAGDAEARAKSEEVDRIVKGHTHSTSHHLRQLRETRETIQRIEDFMRKAQQQ